MLVKITLPLLLTLPEKVSNWPGNDRSGHTLVTMIPGVVVSGQVADAVFVTRTLVQLSLPVTVTVLLTEHAPAGTVKVAVKFVHAPGVRLGTVNTVPIWLLTTTTLFKVTLPGLQTVPV